MQSRVSFAMDDGNEDDQVDPNAETVVDIRIHVDDFPIVHKPIPEIPAEIVRLLDLRYRFTPYYGGRINTGN